MPVESILHRHPPGSVQPQSFDVLRSPPANDNSRWCLAAAGELYLIYLSTGGTTRLDLAGATGRFTVGWYDPRHGGPLRTGGVASVTGGRPVWLGEPPDTSTEDWLVVVRR